MGVAHPAAVAPAEARRFVQLAAARAVRKITLQVRCGSCLGLWLRLHAGWAGCIAALLCLGCRQGRRSHAPAARANEAKLWAAACQPPLAS